MASSSHRRRTGKKSNRVEATLSRRSTLFHAVGVQFFFSCITSVASNLKAATEDSQTSAPNSFPAIVYFIVYKKCGTCDEKTLFLALHNEDLETDITTVRVRGEFDSNALMEKAARELFQVVKDHNNACIQEMLDLSNTYCYNNSVVESSSDDEDDKQMKLLSNRFPCVPCVLVVVNSNEFDGVLSAAVSRLRSDG